MIIHNKKYFEAPINDALAHIPFEVAQYTDHLSFDHVYIYSINNTLTDFDQNEVPILIKSNLYK